MIFEMLYWVPKKSKKQSGKTAKSFDGSGIMRANQWVRNTNNEHVWYYVGNDGAMVTNTSINGYNINANGECIC